MWKYKIGTVVREKEGLWRSRYPSDAEFRPMFGHIVGFANNGHETTLKVQWDDAIVSNIHPSNVLFEG
jgi:hypothetical protein